MILLAIAGWTELAAAQVDSADSPAGGNRAEQDPLAAKQQIARDRMIQLEDRMYRLAQKLAATEPEQAKRLEEALRRSRELLIRHHMDEVIALLDKGDTSTAADRESAVSKGVEQLLAILLADPDRRKEVQEDIDRLRALDQKLQELIQRQSQLKDQLQPASTPADMQDATARQRGLKDETGQLARQMQAGKPQGNENQPGSRPEDSSTSQPASGPATESASRPGDEQQSKDEQQKKNDQESQGRSDQNQAGQQATPGTENVQQAEQHMQNAADKLQNQQSKAAQADQQKAIDQLEQARKQLADTLDQLRREQQEEILRSLESRFRAMLARQEAVNRQTAGLEVKGSQAWVHADELALAGLAQEENALAGEADEALRILKEEGTTIVFPQVVEELRDDLREVSTLLQARQTGPNTTALQADIVDLLKELIDAVQQLRQQMQAEPRQPKPDSSNKPPPLLPGSAEMKMLRSCQMRINRMTQQLHAAETAEPTAPDRQSPTRKVAERQRQVAEMARKMNERISGQ